MLAYLPNMRVYQALEDLPFQYADGRIDDTKRFSKGDLFVVEEVEYGIDPMQNHSYKDRIQEVHVETVKNFWWFDPKHNLFAGKFLSNETEHLISKQ